jgi:hypothetical protein
LASFNSFRFLTKRIIRQLFSDRGGEGLGQTEASLINLEDIAVIIDENQLKKMIARVEPVIPNAVLTRASEIPVERARASGAPDWARAANARIIPITVPIRPISTEIEAIVERITMFLERTGSSRAVASSIPVSLK